MSAALRPMTIADYEDAFALWKETEGIGLSAADERPAIARYLARNPGLSLVATESGQMVGTVLCGHDGRRGYIHHLAVAREWRGRGVGRDLVGRCVEALAAEGIAKCHIFVYARNTDGQGFWRATGWTMRDDLSVMSRETRPQNACRGCTAEIQSTSGRVPRMDNSDRSGRGGQAECRARRNA